jgi:hypothetical protein
MLESKHRPADDEVATRLYPDMPNYVGSEVEFLVAVEVGLADIRAGRTKTAAEINAKYRRTLGTA